MQGPAVFVLALLLTACVLDPVELDGRSCPCVEGWVCDVPRDRCVRALSADAAVEDAGAGETDAGDADAGPDAGPPTACDALTDAIFCEDFESGALDRWTRVDALEGGTIEWMDAGRSGGRAIRLVAPSETATMLLVSTLQIDQPEVHFRAWVRVVDGALGAPLAFELRAGDRGSVRGHVVTSRRGFEVSAGAAGGSRSSDESDADLWVPGVWTCVRARVVRGPTVRGRVEIRGDGPIEAQLRFIPTDYGQDFDAFSIGISADGPSQIEIDDVAWSTRDLACD